MDKKIDEALREAIQTRLQEQFNQGIAVGMRSACSVILEKIHTTEGGNKKKLNAVEKFCDVMVKIPDTTPKAE